MRVKGKFTGLASSETCCRFGKEPFPAFQKFIQNSEYAWEEREISSWTRPLRDCRVEVFIDYQSSSTSITFGRSCRAAELEYEHKENKEDSRYSRGKSIQSLFKCQLPGRAVLKSCEQRLGLGHGWEGGRRWLSKAGAVGNACTRNMLRREKELLTGNCI